MALSATHVFTFDALHYLNRKLSEVESSADFFATVDDVAADLKMITPLSESIEFSSELRIDGKPQKHDGHNAVEVLESIGFRDRAFGADARVWSYLSLVTLREYLTLRWPIDKEEKFQDRIRSRWFLTPSAVNARNLMRNGISRLWWTAYLTQDLEFRHSHSRKNNDEYAYTKWILDKDDRRQYLLENELGWTSDFLFTSMDVLIEDQGGLNAKKSVLGLTRNLNLQTGFRRLDVMNNAELQNYTRTLRPQKEK